MGVGFLSSDRLFTSDIYTEVERDGRFYYLVKDFNFDFPGYIGYVNSYEGNISIHSKGNLFLDDIRVLSIASIFKRFLPKSKIHVKINNDYTLMNIFEEKLVINSIANDALEIQVGKVVSNYKHYNNDMHKIIYGILCYKSGSDISLDKVKNASELYFNIIKDIKKISQDIFKDIPAIYKLKDLSKEDTDLLGFGCYVKYYEYLASGNKIHIFLKYSLEFCKRILRRLKDDNKKLTDLHWTIEECLCMLQSQIFSIFGTEFGSKLWDSL